MKFPTSLPTLLLLNLSHTRTLAKADTELNWLLQRMQLNLVYKRIFPQIILQAISYILGTSFAALSIKIFSNSLFRLVFK